MVTPLDCARCHPTEAAEFAASHHARGGNILASLDNFLAETVEGARVPFDPHSPTPGMSVQAVDGLASAALGCMQCHGSKVGLLADDGGMSANTRNGRTITHDPGSASPGPTARRSACAWTPTSTAASSPRPTPAGGRH